MDFEEIPHQWSCPITQELMVDPVIASDGFTYERKAIEQWLLKSNLSPVTRQPINHYNLIPNHALKHTIQQYLNKSQNKQNPKSNKVSNLEKPNKNKQQIKQQLGMNASWVERQDEMLVNVEIVPPHQPSNGKRKPCCIICVVDVSESMNTDAVLGGKDVESHGFSRLDLVKHSLNTMIEFMDDCDSFAAISFSNAAKILIRPKRMTQVGKTEARNKLKDLFGQGSTNIWDGLKVGLEMMKQIENQYQNVFMVLLTDGQPNLNPPRGIVPTLKKFIDIQKLSSPNIHVFGYGYELDANVLSQIALTGNGTYVYIPDCSMVGTAFVNFMASALATLTNQLQLNIITPQNVTINQIIGMSKNNVNCYKLGCIQYGQSRNVSFTVPKQTQINEIKLIVNYGKNLSNETLLKIQQINLKDNATHILLRSQYLGLLQRCINNGKKIKMNLEMIEQFQCKWKKVKVKDDWLDAVIRQVGNDDENEGQVKKSYDKQQWYQKWGKHYIPSLFLAHLRQTCTNFKDPALQSYGGSSFQQFQANMDTIFIKMQPPKPSAKKQKKLQYVQPPVDMSYYYNNYGGCILSTCRVAMVDGSYKPISHLQKGDKLLSESNKIAILQCLVEKQMNCEVQMVNIQNLWITPYHPIKINGKWVFPKDYQHSQIIYVDKFYNYVLSGGQSLVIENIQCIGLGHGIKDDIVAQHQYLGTHKVIDDLKNSNNWQSGKVQVMSELRDLRTKKIIRYLVKND